MAYPRVVSDRIPVEVLKEHLSFDFEAGIIRWRKKGFKRKLGEEAGWDCNGYRHVTINYRTVRVHRAIWAVFHGAWPDSHIDHIDGDPMNNRLANLRLATPVENSINKKMQRNNTSGFTGVSLHSETGKWRAAINKGGKKTSLGLFDAPELAAEAYRAAAIALHGNFARAK